MLHEMDLVGVRLIESGDLGERVRWFNHPRIYQNMPLDTPVSLAGTRAWHSRIVLDSTRKDFVFARLDQEDTESELVVMGGLVSIDYRHQRCELYVAVNPFMIGQGFGRRAVQWMCYYAFTRIGVRRVFLYTVADNERANQFYQRLGFVKEGVLREHQIHMGRVVDRCVFGLLKEEWAEHWDKEDITNVVEVGI